VVETDHSGRCCKGAQHIAIRRGWFPIQTHRRSTGDIGISCVDSNGKVGGTTSHTVACKVNSGITLFAPLGSRCIINCSYKDTSIILDYKDTHQTSIVLLNERLGDSTLGGDIIPCRYCSATNLKGTLRCHNC
jgi:hypothetical protein